MYIVYPPPQDPTLHDFFSLCEQLKLRNGALDTTMQTALEVRPTVVICLPTTHHLSPSFLPSLPSSLPPFFPPFLPSSLPNLFPFSLCPFFSLQRLSTVSLHIVLQFLPVLLTQLFRLLSTSIKDPDQLRKDVLR